MQATLQTAGHSTYCRPQCTLHATMPSADHIAHCRLQLVMNYNQRQCRLTLCMTSRSAVAAVSTVPVHPAALTVSRHCSAHATVYNNPRVQGRQQRVKGHPCIQPTGSRPPAPGAASDGAHSPLSRHTPLASERSPPTGQ